MFRVRATDGTSEYWATSFECLTEAERETQAKAAWRIEMYHRAVKPQWNAHNAESVFDQLKNISNIEHLRHRSVTNFLVNVLAGLTGCTFREKKPSLNIQIKELALLSA